MEDYLTNLFNNMFKPTDQSPMELFKTMSVKSEAILANTIKYHKACATYHQALHDMMEAVTDNAKIMKGDA